MDVWLYHDREYAVKATNDCGHFGLN